MLIGAFPESIVDLLLVFRTYYDKQILVPVPKTGAYPKKLVYKFGPLSHGWTQSPTAV